MIEAKLSDAVNSIEVFNSLVEKPLSARTAYQVAKLIRELNQEINLFQATQAKIAEKYWECNEDGSVKVDEEGYWHISKEKMPDYAKEVNELLASKIEVNAEPIDLNELLEEKFTPIQMNQIMVFIKE